MDDSRWAVQSNSNSTGKVIIPKEEKFPDYYARVERSIAFSKQRAVFIHVGSDYMKESTTMHLSADDAEAMATVLMYLADQWRKENPDATT